MEERLIVSQDVVQGVHGGKKYEYVQFNKQFVLQSGKRCG